MQPLQSLDLLPIATPGKQDSRRWLSMATLYTCLIGLVVLLTSSTALAHGVAEGDASFIQSQAGAHFWPYFYLGAKHMVTGYDHLLFLAGVVFFLYRLREVATYVTLFALGHSLTLLTGVAFNIPANAYIIDAIIGFSVVYKAFENVGGFRQLGLQINTKIAVAVFGLFHGFGLATKLQALDISSEGLIANLVAFNIGVEAGQLLALTAIVACINLWRSSPAFARQATVANFALMSAGTLLICYQLTGYFTA